MYGICNKQASAADSFQERGSKEGFFAPKVGVPADEKEIFRDMLEGDDFNRGKDYRVLTYECLCWLGLTLEDIQENF